MTSLLVSSVRPACLSFGSDAVLYHKKLIQDHRKTDPEKRERCGNKPSAISQSDAHISMLSRVNKKTDKYPERVKK